MFWVYIPLALGVILMLFAMTGAVLLTFGFEYGNGWYSVVENLLFMAGMFLSAWNAAVLA